MSWFFWAYFIPSALVALLAAIMPVRRFEKWPRILIGLALPLAVLNGTLMTTKPGDVGDIPISLCLDAMVVFIAHRMLRMRSTGAVVAILFISIASILLTLMRLNTDVQVIVANFMEIATVVNGVFIIQLFLVAFLAFEYMLVQKGWMCTKPVNYFKIARENTERGTGRSNKGTVHSSSWRKP